MKHLKTIGLGLSLALVFASCSKKDSATVSTPLFQAGQTITGDTLGGPLKGTMVTNKTYTITSDVTVNKGDTLLIQQGVKLNILNGSSFIVHGTLLSLGTQTNPITFTDPTKTKIPGSPSGPNYADSFNYKGGWGGIYCDSNVNNLVIKWTHLDFPGAGIDVVPFPGVKIGAAYTIYFGSPSNNNATFVLEDSWIYGTPDDVIRCYGGNIYFVRNTVEKFGAKGGDGFNVKGNTQGVMAYNLFVGGATNATKCASDGHVGRQCMIAMFNNTYINCGQRSQLANKTGLKGGCIEVENNSRALVYNNLIVNCRYGMRVAGGAGAKVFLADTLTNNDGAFITTTAYGNNYYYADDSSMTNQFVPTNIAQPVVTYPQSTGTPNMAAFLGSSYTFGNAYDGSSLVGKNNPNFAAFTLPNSTWATQASVDSYNFKLASNSPALGAGTTFTLNTVGANGYAAPIVDPNFGATKLVVAGKDMGAFQADGTGIQH